MCAEVSEEKLKSLLKEFVQLVAHAFYPPKEFLFIDLLVKNTILSEEELGKRLHAEVRQLKAVTNQFTRDKLIRTKLKSIPKPDGTGRPQKIAYYYIDYKMFVNVVRYRLFKMGEKLELEERHSERTNYLCTRTHCEQTYNELDIDKLWNPTDRNLLCERCGAVVEEEEKKTQSSTINSIAKMNLQLKPIYDLLNQFKGSTVPNDMVEPSLDQDHFPNQVPEGSKEVTSQSLVPTNSESKSTRETKHHKRSEIPIGHSGLQGASREEANATEALVRGENIPINSFPFSSQHTSDAEYSDDNAPIGMYVRGRWCTLEELKDLVTRMSTQEKEEYGELCRQAYEEYYD